MRFSSKIILAVAIFTSNAYSKCFENGELWDNTKLALEIPGKDTVCKNITGNGCYVFNMNEVRTYPTVNLI